jgi:hypothetical protein
MRRRAKATAAREFMKTHGNDHPPLTKREQTWYNITGKNPYHTLLPDIDWAALTRAKAHAMGDRTKKKPQ